MAELHCQRWACQYKGGRASRKESIIFLSHSSAYSQSSTSFATGETPWPLFVTRSSAIARMDDPVNISSDGSVDSNSAEAVDKISDEVCGHQL